MLNYNAYLEKVYPYRESVWQREGKGPVWKVGKFLGLRIAYLLYQMHFSANMLDALGFVLSIIAFTLLNVGPTHPAPWLSGILLLHSHTLIDFIDGSLARAKDESSDIGSYLDNVGPDISRVLLLIFLAMKSEHTFLLLPASFSAYVLIFLVKRTWDNVPPPKFMPWTRKIFCHPMGPISGRILLGLIPTILAVFVAAPHLLPPFSFSLTVFYIVMAFYWLFLCTFSNNARKDS